MATNQSKFGYQDYVDSLPMGLLTALELEGLRTFWKAEHDQAQEQIILNNAAFKLHVDEITQRQHKIDANQMFLRLWDAGALKVTPA
jgi:DNA-directed RNA polymerase beta' subunit